ncbi:AGAP008185-PA-like protein [Anopheles sinensis]|uniref:AGAP008185-PA-like protein n=1 Tax=Anopheles sinensis TaxID=74873 RepID=A0A084VWI6_ANOSI|nr:AGAP008185-PA-like protein [Anopheles sinensis]
MSPQNLIIIQQSAQLVPGLKLKRMILFRTVLTDRQNDECKIKPQPLKAGQTVFFVIQPRYMNVDIRFIVDVTQGELDFYMSPTDESFIVQTNGSTGHHDIHLDGGYAWYRDGPGTPSASARAMSSDAPDEVHPLNIHLSDTPATGERNSPACGGQIRYEGYLVTDRTAKDLITSSVTHNIFQLC